jgi:plasmid segregation protein ParM
MSENNVLGIDLGNNYVKVSNNISFDARCTNVAGVLTSNKFTLDNEVYYIQSGNYDMEYRKINKKNTRILLGYALARSAVSSVKAVVGLPISQYNQDKHIYKEQLLSKRVFETEIEGTHKRIIVEDVEIYPEGVSSILFTDYQGIILDIGGRTTDCAKILGNADNKKIISPDSLGKGIFNLYSDFIKVINAKFGLDLTYDDASYIVSNGLKIDGKTVNIDFAMDIFNEFVDDVVNILKLKYTLSTLDVKVIGGGGQSLFKFIKDRIPQATLMDNSFMANALAYKRLGDKIWQ